MTARSKIKITLDEGACTPTKAHPNDASVDLYSREDIVLAPFSSGVFNTGVHVDIPAGYAGLLISKSNLNIQMGLTSEGLINSGSTGPIMVKLYNSSERYFDVHKGDKITQLLIVPIITPEFQIVNSTEEFDSVERS